MTRLIHKKSEHGDKTAKPIVEKMRWPFPLIWLVPVLAAVMVGYYVVDRMQDRGPLVTLRFADATGLKAGESRAVHLGVQFGQVTGVELTPDKTQALVQLRLRRTDSAFARKGTLYWIVRPEISTQEISGLATVISGPVIDAIPGTGEMQTQFTGLEKPPPLPHAGLRIVLTTPHLEHLQADSPIYFRGIQVGSVEDVELSADATNARIHALIEPRYMPLVKTNSQFWALSPVDVKGGIFTGIQMKLESLQSLLSGGIAFATPQEKMGAQARNGATFVLNDEPKKEWLGWAPEIPIHPDSGGQPATNPAFSPLQNEIHAAAEKN